MFHHGERSKMSIPKIIHYFFDDTDIWAKNTKSQVRMCINSWLKCCPDYKIMLWNDKIPEFQGIIKKSKFAQKAYELKLWAFVADYIRFYALKKYGGIYLDTDVQLVDNFDKFLNNRFFCSIELDILDNENIPEPAVMGTEPNHPLCDKVLSIYESDKIFSIDNFIANVITKKALKELYGFKYINYSSEEYTNTALSLYKNAPKYYQPNDYNLYLNQRIWQDENKEVTIYPNEYFCPSWSKYKTEAFTDNTVAIHWNQSSWWNGDKLTKIKSFAIKNPFKKFVYLQKKILQNIFSIRNSDDKKHKIITIIFLKFSFEKRKSS